MIRRRGITYLEVLAAALLLTIAAAGALSSWQLATRAPVNKRVTEMGSILASREIERLKAIKYLNLPIVPANNPTTTYYDKFGQAAGAPVAGGYMVKSWVIVPAGMPSTGSTSDLLELHAEVWDNAGASRYEAMQTLLTFGGL